MFVKILATTLCVIGVALAEQSPVFLWGVKGPLKPSLQAVTENDFSDIAATYLKDHMIVAFEENALSSSDFLCSNAETYQSCYAHLQGVKTKTYYANVENPVDAIRSVAQTKEHNTITSQGRLATPLDCQVGKAVFVNFEDTSEQKSRAEQLEAHDAAIAAISKSSECPTVFVYLATPSTGVQKRSRRAAIEDTAAPQGGTYYRDGANFLIFFTNLYLYDASSNTQTEIKTTGMPPLTTNSPNNFTVSLTTSDGKALNFLIYLDSDYYYMGNIVYDKTTYRVVDANAPPTFSYHCGNLTADCIPNAADPTATCNTALLWQDLQLQAPFGTTTDTAFAFGDSWDCVPFFTPGILMGLFVLIFLLVITFIGICWMMDINTMDRFDDPKGKTITINASE